MIQAPLRYYRHLRGKQAFVKAETLAREGKAAEAAEAFDLASALSGDDLELRRDAVEAAADLYQSLGRAAETAQRAEQLAELAPDDAGVILRLARARDIIGRREDAAAAWTRRLELAPDCDQAPRRLADLLSGGAAIPHLRTLAHRAPDELAAWTRLGEALTAEGDFAGAADAWTRRLAVVPDCDEAPRRLADLLRGAAALPHIRTLARRAPNDAEAWARLALALDAEHDASGAADAWSHLAALTPDDLAVRRRAITLLLGLNRQAEAAAHLEAATALSPGEAGLWKALARACRTLGDSEGELRGWLGAARAQPEKAVFRVEIVRLLTAAGRAEEATAHLVALARLQGDDADLWRRSARALAGLGDEAAAAEAWTRLLAIDDSDLEAHRALAAFHRAAQRPADALPHLRFEADTIGGAGIFKRVALTLDLIGDTVEAEAAWRRLLALDPTRGDALARVIGLARKRGEPAAAVDVARAALAAEPDNRERLDGLVELLLEAGDGAGALAALRGAADARPQALNLVVAMVDLRLRLDDAPGAIADLQRAADLEPQALALVADFAPRLAGEAEGLRVLLRRAQESRPDDVGLLRALARNLGAGGDAEGAFALWSQVLQHAPGDVTAARTVGLHLYELGRRAEAAPGLAIAAAAAPKDLKIWRRLAWAQRGAENVEGEITALRHLLAEMTPDDDEGKLRLIDLLTEAGRRGEAEPLLAEMVDKYPDDIRLRTGLALARRDRGDAEGSLAVWRQVLQINPGEPAANYAVGEALADAGDLRAAADHLAAAAPAAVKQGAAWSRVVRLRREAGDADGEIVALQNQIATAASTDLATHKRLAQLLEAAGRSAEGEASLSRIAADRPDDAKTLRRLGRARAELGRWAEAAEAWTRLLGLIPNDAEAQLALAQWRLDLGEPVLAAALLEAAADAASGDLWARAGREFARQDDADPAAEIAAWRQALAREPNLGEAHARLAELLVAIGEGAAASPHLAFTVAASPDDHRLRKTYAVTLRAAGRLHEAADQFGRVARQRPTSRRPWRRYARALDEAGDLDGAARAWRHVLALGGDGREARENLGLLLQRLGRFDEAAGYLQGHRGRTARRLRRLDEATARLGGLHAAFAQADLKLLDIGARGGPLAWTTLLAPYATYFACEPEPAEAARLVETVAKAHPWRDVRVVPEGLGREAGSARLRLTAHSGFSSVYTPSTKMAARFGLSAEMAVTGDVEIPVITLAQAAARYGFEDVGLVKIDTQGSELDILRGGEALLKGPVQAVFAEVEFREFYNGQPLFGDVDRYLRSLGFELLRLEPVSRRRVRKGRKLSYSRHEVVWAHVLFVKRAPDAATLSPEVFLRRTLQQIAVAVAYELFDLAAELAEGAQARSAFAAAGLSVEVADIEAFAASGVAARLARDFAKAWPDQLKGVPKAYTS